MDRRRKLLRETALVVGLFLGGGAIGSVAVAIWTSTRPVDEAGSTATVALGLGDTTSLTARLDDLLPGDGRDHTIDVTNTSSAPATLAYAVRGSGGQPVTTDASDGLRVRVWTCSVAYVSGACGGVETEATTTSGADVPDGSAATVWTDASVPATQTRHLRIRVLLPASAPSTRQGQSFTVSHVFSASLAGTGAT